MSCIPLLEGDLKGEELGFATLRFIEGSPYAKACG